MKFENTPRYTKYLCWYITEMDKPRSTTAITIFSILVCTILTIIILIMPKCNDELQLIYKSHYSKEELKLASIFANHGSTHPVEMAIAVCKTKKPALMAAIAIKETNGKLYATGDKGQSKGAFQIQEKHWGKIGITATEQALQAEKILEELVRASRGLLRQGLAKYNGGNRPSRISYRYANKVIVLARQIKKERVIL